MNTIAPPSVGVVRARRSISNARQGSLVGSGGSADVFEWDPVTASTATATPAVVKRHRGPSSRRLALAEAAALSCLEHPHVIRVLDLDDDYVFGDGEGEDHGDAGIGLVLPRLSVESAAHWLESRRVVTAGEAVTLLIPLLRVLVHIERRRLGPCVRLAATMSLDNVLFDDRGAPVVTSVRAAPTAGLDRLRSIQASPSEVGRQLVTQVLERTVGGAAEARRELSRVLTARLPTGDRGADAVDLDALIECVFALDRPAALEAALAPADLDDDGWDVATEGREGMGGLTSRSRPVVTTAGEDASLPPHPLDDLVPGLRHLREVVASSPTAQRLTAVAREVRPRVWITTGVVLLSTGVAASALAQNPDSQNSEGAVSDLPTSARPDAPSPGPPLPDSATAGSASPGPAGQASLIPSAPIGGTDSPRPLFETPQADPTSSVLTGDDPARAATRLLELRAACLHELDTRCLSGVDQAESPALQADLAFADEPSSDVQPAISVTLGSEVNRFGGSVLFDARASNGDPATILVVRTAAGWRLRDVRH